MGDANGRAIQLLRITLIAVIVVIVLSSIGTMVFSKVRTYHGDGKPIAVRNYVESSFIDDEQDQIQINMTDLDIGRLTVFLRTPDRVLSNFSAVYLELIDLTDHSSIANRTVFSYFLFNLDELWIPHHGDYRLVVVKNDMEDDPISIRVVYENYPAIFLSDLGPWILLILIGCMAILSVTFIIEPKKEEDTILMKDRKWVGWTLSSVSISFGIASAVSTLIYPPFFLFCVACPLTWIITIPLAIIVGIVILGITVIAFLTGVIGIARKRGRPLAVIGLVLSLLSPTLIFSFIVVINLGMVLTEVFFE